MSIYSGKCDFYDVIDINGEDWIFDKSKFYIHTDDGNKEIKFSEKRDMIPFYPHIVASMASSKKTGATIWLSQYPYPYIENKEYWDMTVKRFRKKLDYRRQKARRTGVPLNETDFVTQFIHDWAMSRDNDEQLRDVCNQIINKHRTIKYPLRNGAKWYMTTLCKKMKDSGLDPTTFGYIVEDGKVVDYDKAVIKELFNNKEDE